MRGAACIYAVCRKQSRHFTIHGLWRSSAARKAAATVARPDGEAVMFAGGHERLFDGVGPWRIAVVTIGSLAVFKLFGKIDV